MKIKIFLIIFLTQIILYNCLEYYQTEPLQQYGTLTLPLDGDYNLVVFPLDISNFKTQESIFFYFQFDPLDALDDNKKPRITFYVIYINTIDDRSFYLFDFIKSPYEIKPKKIKDTELKTIFYFETNKQQDYKYLVICAHSPEYYIQYPFIFNNTQKDEGAINTKLGIILLFFTVAIILF